MHGSSQIIREKGLKDEEDGDWDMLYHISGWYDEQKE